jgi:sec-independent protein translocase protein TatA
MPGFGSLGGSELLIALVIILLLFGAKRIPELAKGLGSGVREFKKGARGQDEPEVEKEKNDAPKGEEITAGEDKPHGGGAEAEEAVRAEEAEEAEHKQRT